MYILNGQKVESVTSKQRLISNISRVMTPIVFIATFIVIWYAIREVIPASFFEDWYYRIPFWILFFPMIGINFSFTFGGIRIGTPPSLELLLMKFIIHEDKERNAHYIALIPTVVAVLSYSSMICAIFIPDSYDVLFHLTFLSLLVKIAVSIGSFIELLMKKMRP